MIVDRRAFLKRTAGGLLALPLLQLPSRVRAQSANDYPTRLIIFYQPNGTKKEFCSPQSGATERDFELGPLLRPLRRFKDKLVVLDGIDMAVAGEGPGGPHQRGMASLLSGAVISEGDFVGGDGRRAGWGGGISIDQFLAREMSPATQLSTLELGVRVNEAVPRSRIVYRGPDQPVPPESDPVLAFQRLFGQPGSEMQSMAEVERRLSRRQSVLDSVYEDFRQIQNKVSSADRAKLEQHGEVLRDLERRLGLIVTRSDNCQPDSPSPMNVMGEEEYSLLLRSQIDIMVNAMACDLTRYATLQCSTAVNALRFTFLELTNHDGHALSHSGDGNDALQIQWERMLVWYAEQLAYLIERLDSIPEGDGTLLDNTLILAVSEISRGNTHSHSDMPFILAGNAGGRLETGRYLRYDGASHNDLLVSVLNAVGHPAETFGDRRFCTGPLVGL